MSHVPHSNFLKHLRFWVPSLFRTAKARTSLLIKPVNSSTLRTRDMFWRWTILFLTLLSVCVLFSFRKKKWLIWFVPDLIQLFFDVFNVLNESELILTQQFFSSKQLFSSVYAKIWFKCLCKNFIYVKIWFKHTTHARRKLFWSFTYSRTFVQKQNPLICFIPIFRLTTCLNLFHSYF